MPKPLLLVMSPRNIPECIAAIRSLNIDKAWLKHYTEAELVNVIPQVIAECDHDPIGILSDDGVPTQQSLDLVLNAYEPSSVYSGYSNIETQTTLVNLCDKPLIIREQATDDCYSLIERETIEEYLNPLMPVYFAGLSLTFMSRAHWNQYPFMAYGNPGWQSDYLLCKRLQIAGERIWAVRGAFFLHLRAGLTTTHLEGGEVIAGGNQGWVEWDYCETP